MRVKSNRDHIKKENRDKLKYISTKARERDQSVKEIRSAMAEDIEQRKEIAKLRKMDRDEFM